MLSWFLIMRSVNRHMKSWMNYYGHTNTTRKFTR
ncbi:hypothetical protein FNJ88_06720 [Chryseobacterium sp. SNU WT5]|nr:hypothetical protein FNJ88_06720 [Chryseobacterium sp. SNU WT5]